MKTVKYLNGRNVLTTQKVNASSNNEAILKVSAMVGRMGNVINKIVSVN